MNTTFLIFHLWLTPVVSDGGTFGMKTTLQVGYNLWLKFRVYDNREDRNSLVLNTGVPKVVLRAETDF